MKSTSRTLAASPANNGAADGLGELGGAAGIGRIDTSTRTMDPAETFARSAIDVEEVLEGGLVVGLTGRTASKA